MSLKNLDPFDGPASENAYPEDHGIEIDGKPASLNSLSRIYNSIFGETDEAADKPWGGPDGEGEDAQPDASKKDPPKAGNDNADESAAGEAE